MRQNERVAWAAVGFMMAACLVTLGLGQPGASRRRITAEELVIVNSEGKTVVMIGSDSRSKSGTLSLHRKDGEIYLMTGTQEQCGYLWLCHDPSQRMVSMGVNDNGDAGQIILFDKAGKAITTVPSLK